MAESAQGGGCIEQLVGGEAELSTISEEHVVSESARGGSCNEQLVGAEAELSRISQQVPFLIRRAGLWWSEAASAHPASSTTRAPPEHLLLN